MGLQDAIAAALAAIALGWLVWRRVHRRARPTPLCGDCPGCAPPPATPARDAHGPMTNGATSHQAFIPVSELRAPDA